MKESLAITVQRLERNINCNYGIIYAEEPFGPFIVSLQMYELLMGYYRPRIKITLKNNSILGNQIVETLELCGKKTVDDYFDNEEPGEWREPKKKTVNIKSEIIVEKPIDLRNEVKQLNSAIGINSLEDMAKLQIEPLTRDMEKKYSIVKADYENLKSTVIMFRNMIEKCDKPTIPKDDLLADIAMFFNPFLTEVTE